MPPEECLANALRSSEPVPALRGLVEEMAQQGSSKSEIYELLEKFLVQLRTQPDPRVADEEAVLDVMDALSGWCHPDAALLPESRPQ